MNEQKQKQAQLAASLFSGIEAQIRGVVTAKQTYKADLAKLGELSYYTPEHLETRKIELRLAYDQARGKAYEKISASLDELRAALEEKHGTLDLASPEWTNALRLIEIGGDTLDYQTIGQINSAFAHDQPALRALQTIYKARGIENDGGIAKMIYEIEPSFKRLQETAELVLIREGGPTIGTLARAVGEIAGLEGVSFDTSPDPDALQEAVNIGAGLAVMQ
ncbi:hypothetical protein FBQ81_04105 [Chloroflexi bacterium CFX6]|nr:hypothetical protein [Chloroflexi bacterium CFX6]